MLYILINFSFSILKGFFNYSIKSNFITVFLTTIYID